VSVKFNYIGSRLRSGANLRSTLPLCCKLEFMYQKKAELNPDRPAE
jgi:hypothetical protein